ncbi:MAG TPA: DNA methylase, partial [Pseudomonas sp.]|nr:DNA methylase [Pseudomonas sp.]
LKKYQTTNPTWIKKPNPRNRTRPSLAKIQLEFATFRERLALQNELNLNKSSESLILTGDSRNLPLPNESIDLTITSPPYCTRIDYAVATSVELSVLSCSKTKFSELRDALIGTTTVTDGISANSSWGKTCCDTLEKIRIHPSKASSSYYTKNFLRYFDSLFKSICEITRTTKSQGKCYMVIQDSYYKEIHIDLPLIASEMFCSNGWTLEIRQDFVSPRNKATINSKSTKYQNKKTATESVITLRKKP